MINPALDRVVMIKDNVTLVTPESLPFRELDEVHRQARALSKDLRTIPNVTVAHLGLVTVEADSNWEGKSRKFRIFRSSIFEWKERRKAWVPVRGSNHPFGDVIAMPIQCPCGRAHFQWGMEIEFDAYSYSKLGSAQVTNVSLPFQPIGRDGSGQGEVRGMPANQFRKAAQSALENYRKALAIVRESTTEMERIRVELARFKSLVMEMKNIDCETLLPGISRDRETLEASPNGIHVHGPKSDYLSAACRMVAVWWNQHTAQAREMLAKRNQRGYGTLESDTIRASGVCRKYFRTATSTATLRKTSRTC